MKDVVGIGPVIIKIHEQDAWVRAFRELNPGLSVTDRGSYLRINSPKQCILTKAVLEKHLGSSIELRQEIHSVMVSFSGKISVSDNEITWSDL